MRRGIVAVIVVLVCLFAFQKSSFAEDGPDKFSYRVHVRIYDDERAPIKNQVESYVKRELRALGDVIVTDTDARIILQIDVMDLALSGEVKGNWYAWAVSYLLPLESVVSLCVRDSQAPPEKFWATENLMHPQELEELKIHVITDMRIVGKNKIEAVSKEVVAILDTTWIEKYRKEHQDRLDGLKSEEPDGKQDTGE